MATYFVSTITYSPSTLSSPTTLSLTDDAASAALPLPFTATIYGVAYTSLYIQSNGLMMFGSSVVQAIQADPGTKAADTFPRMVGFGSDLVPSGSTQPKYQILGTSPNRIFVADYTNIPFYNTATSSASTTNFVTFQIKLYETSSNLEVHVTNWPGATQNIYGWLGIINGATPTDETTKVSAASNVSNTAYLFSTSSASTPGIPTNVSATASDSSATVSFTPPSSDGGSTITSYTVTSTPGSFTASGSASPITVTGLVNGTAYTFTVYATNSVGKSAESSSSNSVTPQAIPVTVAWLHI